jgi:hypothetical protein
MTEPVFRKALSRARRIGRHLAANRDMPRCGGTGKYHYLPYANKLVALFRHRRSRFVKGGSFHSSALARQTAAISRRT